MDTNQLLMLLSSGELVTMETHGDRCYIDNTTSRQLNDFKTRYPSLSWLSDHTPQLQLFSFNTYYGIYYNGGIR